MTTRVAVLMCGLVVLGAVNASAQMSSPGDRVFANVNFGVAPTTSKDISQADASFSIYQETATVGYSKRHLVNTGGPLADLTFGGLVHTNFGVAFNYWHQSSSADVTLTASIPDPIVFDKPRTVTTDVTGLSHSENWISFLAVYAMSVTDKIDVMLLVGPAMSSVSQEVSEFTIPSTEGPSGPQIPMTRSTLSDKAWGYQAGADARYMFNKTVGAGIFMRVTQATAHLNSTTSLSVGGFQLGGGLRLKF